MLSDEIGFFFGIPCQMKDSTFDYCHLMDDGYWLRDKSFGKERLFGTIFDNDSSPNEKEVMMM